MENDLQLQQRGRRVKRVLLCCLLFFCIAGAGALGYLAVTELVENKQGEDFYSQLAASVENVSSADDGTPTPTARHSLNLPTASKGADESTPAPAVSATPAPMQTTEPSEVDFDALRQSCPDVVGWIRLENSVIDYPVVLGEDNDFYLHHLADQTPNKAGCIMMDESNDGDFSNEITILHGHHMRNGSMFGDLDEYRQWEYYLEHKTMRLFTPDGDYDVAVFAAYTVDGYSFGYPTSFKDETEFETFLRRALSATPYETEVKVEYGDRILMLSTCAYSYEGARFVVLGKIMEPVA